MFAVSHIMIVLLHFIHSALLCVLFSRLCLISYHRRISYPHNQTICLFLASKDLTWKMVEEGSFLSYNVCRELSEQSCSLREVFGSTRNSVSGCPVGYPHGHRDAIRAQSAPDPKSVYQITVFRPVNFNNPRRPEKTEQNSSP